MLENDTTVTATELTDDEMDNISGGKSIIVEDTANDRNVYRCDHKKIGMDKFEKFLFGKNTCKYYECEWPKGDSFYSEVSQCGKCVHHNFNTYGFLGVGPDGYRYGGYDYKYIKR